MKASRAQGGEPPPRFSLEEVLAILGSSPSRIAETTADVPDDALHQPLEPGGWSARDVLAHIRACDQTWGGYIARILDEEDPSFRAENPRTTILRTDLLEQRFPESLAGFGADRGRLIARLGAVDPDTMSRTASVRIPALGVVERTAFYYADRLAGHEREHVRQIERGTARRR
jgi:DinB superfamily